jgi:hypothetical protein
MTRKINWNAGNSAPHVSYKRPINPTTHTAPSRNINHAGVAKTTTAKSMTPRDASKEVRHHWGVPGGVPHPQIRSKPTKLPHEGAGFPAGKGRAIG